MTTASFKFSRIFFRTFATIVLALSVFQPVASFAADWNIDQLMQQLAKTKSGHATFVERKFIAILEQPVDSSGELFYEAPNKLEKRTLKPKPETMRVDGDNLTIERGRQKQTLNLQDYPELASVIDSIRGTLAGDRKALERFFKIKLEGPAERWTLTLTPADSKVASAIRSIKITGQRANVRTVDVTQADGDSSVMAIEQAASK